MKRTWNKWFAEYYEKLYFKMCSLAYRILGDMEKAKETAQDAFVLTLLCAEGLSKHPNPKGWLMAAVYNLANNQSRRLSFGGAASEPLCAAPAAEQSWRIEEMLPRSLPEEDRKILCWKFRDGLSYREIGECLGISESGGKNRVARAVDKCRKILEDGAFYS